MLYLWHRMSAKTPKLQKGLLLIPSSKKKKQQQILIFLFPNSDTRTIVIIFSLQRLKATHF